MKTTAGARGLLWVWWLSKPVRGSRVEGPARALRGLGLLGLTTLRHAPETSPQTCHVKRLSPTLRRICDPADTAGPRSLANARSLATNVSATRLPNPLHRGCPFRTPLVPVPIPAVRNRVVSREPFDSRVIRVLGGGLRRGPDSASCADQETEKGPFHVKRTLFQTLHLA